MSELPDRRRLDFPQRTRALAAPFVEMALGAAWRVLHPDERGQFVESLRPPPARRLYYDADDGWSAPLFCLPARPGGSGEPVILAHALGLDGDAWRYGQVSVAKTLQRAGFSVYVLSHRGDRDALAPEDAAGFDVDDIIGRDVPAAIEAVRADCGFARVFWVGHGLGGQLGIGAVARGLGPELAGLATLNSAVRFVPPASQMRRALTVSRWLPRGWVVPHELAVLATPLLGDSGLADRFSGLATEPARMRGVLRYVAGDVPVQVVRQVGRWVSSGVLCDRDGQVDYLEAVRGTQLPLLCVMSTGDDACRPAQARALADAWHPDWVQQLCLGREYGHSDVLFARTADADVFQPLVDWLHRHRRQAWSREETTRASGT